MSRFEGTLRFRDIGAGAWVLETENGEDLQLQGPVPEDLDGQEVVVEGRKVGVLGFAMLGSSGIEVATVERK